MRKPTVIIIITMAITAEQKILIKNTTVTKANKGDKINKSDNRYRPKSNKTRSKLTEMDTT